MNRPIVKFWFAGYLAASLLASVAHSKEWATYEGKSGPGKGKHIVLVTGDEEYRSEEAMPMLAKILAERHGFTCTVLFAIDPVSGDIDPTNQTNIPGLEKLESADLMILYTRFRELPDSATRHIDQYLKSGKPIIGLRTATHAFAYSRNADSPYARYDWRSKEWPGGFGQQVLGETWVSHHGDHGKESSRGVINPEYQDDPVLRGVDNIWGPSDVYTVKHLPDSAQVLVWGQVLSGMNPDDAPVEGAKNDPMMPMIWARDYQSASGKTSKVICSTMGAAVDLENEGLRRLLVNGCYWLVGIGDRIPAKADIRYVGEYDPRYFGFGDYEKGLKPADYELK